MSRLILPRRKLLLSAGAALITSPAIIGRAAAQLTMTGVGGGSPAAGGGTFSFISGVSTGVNGAGGGATGAIDTTGAGLLIGTSSYYFAATGLTPTDSKGNTWNSLTDTGGGSARANIYWCKPSSVGSGHTFTVSGTNVFATLTFSAYAFGAASPADQQSANNGTGGNATSTSITPAFGNELVIGAVSTDDNVVAPGTIDGGFTIIDDTLAGSSGNYVGGGAAYLIQTAAAAANPTWVLPNAVNWAFKLASFKVA